MMRDYPPKRRYGNLPPKKLYEILCGIYPKEETDELYGKLMDKERPKEDVPDNYVENNGETSLAKLLIELTGGGYEIRIIPRYTPLPETARIAVYKGTHRIARVIPFENLYMPGIELYLFWLIREMVREIDKEEET